MEIYMCVGHYCELFMVCGCLLRCAFFSVDHLCIFNK